jgi:hypothetical protein
MRSHLFLASGAALLAMCAAKTPVRFPVDKPVLIYGQEYNAEDTMRARADAAIRTCFKYAEESRPEATSDLLVKSVEEPEFVGNAFVFDLTPPFQMCSPKHALDKSLEAFHRQVEAADQSSKKKKHQKKKNEDLLKSKKLSNNKSTQLMHQITFRANEGFGRFPPVQALGQSLLGRVQGGRRRELRQDPQGLQQEDF